MLFTSVQNDKARGRLHMVIVTALSSLQCLDNVGRTADYIITGKNVHGKVVH